MALSILDRRKCWLIQLVHLAQCQLAQCPKHKPIYRNNYLSGRFRYKNRVLFIICRQLDMVRKNRKSLSKASVCFTLRHNKKSMRNHGTLRIPIYSFFALRPVSGQISNTRALVLNSHSKISNACSQIPNIDIQRLIV